VPAVRPVTTASIAVGAEFDDDPPDAVATVPDVTAQLANVLDVL
jgi:hypothetical protein